MKYYECFALTAELSRNKIYLKHKLYYTGMTQKDQGMTHKDTSQLHFNFDFIQNFRYNISIHCNKLWKWSLWTNINAWSNRPPLMAII